LIFDDHYWCQKIEIDHHLMYLKVNVPYYYDEDAIDQQFDDIHEPIKKIYIFKENEITLYKYFL